MGIRENSPPAPLLSIYTFHLLLRVADLDLAHSIHKCLFFSSPLSCFCLSLFLSRPFVVFLCWPELLSFLVCHAPFLLCSGYSHLALFRLFLFLFIASLMLMFCFPFLFFFFPTGWLLTVFQSFSLNT